MPDHAAAIYFHPEAYTTGGPRLMGRNAAGESFLRGFLSYATCDTFWAQVESAEHARAFADTVARHRPGRPARAFGKESLGLIAEPGCIYQPGPGIGDNAWQRAVHGHASWSLCGVTHTTSSDRVMDALADLLVAPVQPWDALICTSSAVRDNVRRVLQAQAEYLQQRLGARRIVLPELPVIPLGIHTADFAFDASARAAARQRLGADDHTHVVLFVGRLSFHAKAHPLAMYQALQQAAMQLPKGESILLVECGWHGNDYIARAFADAAAHACAAVKVRTLEGRQAADRDTAWAAADVFCSLSDNIQETFGITPIEAMAAGLPVVVSDWDGYRDTVRDGVDGFRVPTTAPREGVAVDLAQRHALGIDTYDMYCGHTCSLVAVDIEATAQAFARLFASAELRQQMGDSGRRRARDVYDWARIIPQYEALWTELAHLRRAGAKDLPALPHPWPARLDPFYGYAGYASHTLGERSVLALADPAADTEAQVTRLEALRSLAMVEFARVVHPSADESRALLAGLARGPRSAGELVAAFPPERRDFLLRALAWLMKLGLLVHAERKAPHTTSAVALDPR